MSKEMFKSIVMLLVITAILSVITGCDKKGTIDIHDTDDMIYQADVWNINELQGDVNNIFVQNEKVYLCTSEWSDLKKDLELSEKESEKVSDDIQPDSSETVLINRLYSVCADGSGLKEIHYPKTSTGEWIQSIVVGRNGMLIFLLNAFDEETQNYTYTIVQMDDDGNEIIRENITKLLKISENDYINKMLVDDKGRIILAMDYSVCIIDESIKTLEEIKSESYIESIAMTKNGNVICAVDILTSQSSQVHVKVLDVDEKRWREDYELGVSHLSGLDPLMNGNEYDFYFSDDSGIYGFDMINKKNIKVMDYTASGITYEDGWGIMLLTKNEFVCLTTNEDLTSSLVIYKKVDLSTIKDKKVITLGVMWMDDSVKKQVVEFNKTSGEYRIEIRDYSNDENPIEKWNADIVTGNIPDIICLYGMPYEQYISKGMLEDLTPYFNKDEEIRKEDIIDSLLDTMMSKDGKIYYVAPSFDIFTLVARTRDVGNVTGWTFDELKAILEKQGNNVRPFYFENKSEMLYSFLMNDVEQYVNWETGECSFDRQDFKDILEICNKGTNEESDYEDDMENMSTLIRDGKVLLVEDWISAEHVQLYRKMFEDDITYIGYPDDQKQGSYFQFGNQLAIYSKSEEKEIAWEFIRSFMTKEYQASKINEQSAPTRQDCFDMMLKSKTTTEMYIDEFGQEIYPIEVTLGYGDFEVEIEPLSQEEVDLYVDLVNNTKKVGSSDTKIMEIVVEESKSYFVGEKSLEETIDIIQNRVTVYVNEKR